ncbi:flagellar motor protein MotB [Kineosporia sp. NBRC 101731]|uniref:OmpA/MotB family protein n=1 Tax=Kineosporia sp. NBRC 101731 TaxID=3032199 RepID=UPI00249FD76A|nr:flagellar motor protein MotB [Kineosporia sp. NBRC 101731]GLY27006.1 chemotaxis protein MotB [Kineosporia sp. NBRC 101731]
MSGGGGKRRGHEEEHEEHENHERWLVSYADMMTLLMVLFIVLFAISQVDEKRFAELKAGLANGFGAPPQILEGGTSLLDAGGAVAPDDPNLSGSSGNQKTDGTSGKSGNLGNIDPQKVAELARATQEAQVKGEVKNLKKARDDLKRALQKAGLKNGATFRFNERGLVVTIATDNVLFKSGSDQIQPRGERILIALGPTLRALPNQLSIDGHTNSIPIRTAKFGSNWELSGYRASNVLRYMHNRDKIPFGRMTFTGYADTQPRLPASDPRSVVVNRRVEIIVLARVDDSAGQAVEDLGNASSSSAD